MARTGESATPRVSAFNSFPPFHRRDRARAPSSADMSSGPVAARIRVAARAVAMSAEGTAACRRGGGHRWRRRGGQSDGTRDPAAAQVVVAGAGAAHCGADHPVAQRQHCAGGPDSCRPGLNHAHVDVAPPGRVGQFRGGASQTVKIEHPPDPLWAQRTEDPVHELRHDLFRGLPGQRYAATHPRTGPAHLAPCAVAEKVPAVNRDGWSELEHAFDTLRLVADYMNVERPPVIPVRPGGDPTQVTVRLVQLDGTEVRVRDGPSGTPATPT